MSIEKPAGFFISQGRIALALSVITLLGVFYQASAFLMSSQYRIDALENNQAQTIQQLDRLNNTINDLNVTLREVQIRQEFK